MFKNASVAPFVVRRFVRSFIRRSFVRSSGRPVVRSSGRPVGRSVVRSSGRPVVRSSGRPVVLSLACSFLRFFIRWSVRFSACPSIVRLFVAHYWSFFIHCSSFIVRLLSFVHSFVLRSIEKSVVPVFVQSVDRSFSLSIDWSVRRNHKTHFDTSKDVMTAGAELSSLANAVCIVSLCLSTRRLLHTLNGTKQKKKTIQQFVWIRE